MQPLSPSIPALDDLLFCESVSSSIDTIDAITSLDTDQNSECAYQRGLQLLERGKYPLAVEHLHFAARDTHSAAAAVLSTLYAVGVGVAVDIKASGEFFLLGLEKEKKEALPQIRDRIRFLQGVIETANFPTSPRFVYIIPSEGSPASPLDLRVQAARDEILLCQKALAEDPPSLYALAKEVRQRHSSGEWSLLSLAASLGHRKAIQKCLRRTEDLIFTPAFLHATAKENANMLCELGIAYIEGRGMQKKPERGFSMIRKAAALGSSKAERILQKDSAASRFS
ncbi:MAG: hypothetical protein JSR76_04745 [Verrucomicrobia bacterium]|nr:hypothetical protein [Verrucomicrobiota bacterium]